MQFLHIQNHIEPLKLLEPRVLAKTAGIGTAGTKKTAKIAEIRTAKTVKTAGIRTAGTGGIANEKSWNHLCLIGLTPSNQYIDLNL